MKAIQTEYNGILFRSRLEARWAIFFDALNLAWIYEPECFELSDGKKYTPDFYIPKFNLYIEIKPNEDWKNEIYHLERYRLFKKDLVILDVPFPELGKVSNCNIQYYNFDLDENEMGVVFCPNSKYEPFFYSGLSVGDSERLFDYSKELDIVKQHRFWK